MSRFDPEKLKEQMVQKGISVPELAGTTGLSSFGIYKLLNGTRPDPGVSTVARIANTLEIDVKDLLQPAIVSDVAAVSDVIPSIL